MVGWPQLTEREKERKRESEGKREERERGRGRGRGGERRGEEEKVQDDQCRICKQCRLSLDLRFGDFSML